ncbi:MAG: hypothetical protein ACOCTR_04250 [Candidatus Natronoplasma sp.]
MLVFCRGGEDVEKTVTDYTIEIDSHLDPDDKDTDGDGAYDGDEGETHALKPDTDGDGWKDGPANYRSGLFYAK